MIPDRSMEQAVGTAHFYLRNAKEVMESLGLKYTTADLIALSNVMVQDAVGAINKESMEALVNAVFFVAEGINHD